MRRLIFILAVGLGAACGSSEPAMQGGGPDAGMQTTSVALQTWVKDLVDNRTADDAVPDTVEDKRIVDTEDPSAFDSYVR